MNPFSKLAEIKESLPIKEEVVYPKDTGFNYECDKLKEGDKIIRPVVLFNTGRKLVLRPAFQKNERKAQVIRATLPTISKKFFTNFPVATNDKNGLVCFCNSEVPSNWIYFTIEKISAKKNFAIVSFKKGTEEELFGLYNFPK